MNRPTAMLQVLLTGASCLALATASGSADAQSTEASQTAPSPAPAKPLQLAEAGSNPPARARSAPTTSVSEVVVTAQKKSENVQKVPIAVSALSQKELTARQIAGGPDLIKEVPNLTFSKTNFTGYNLEIRGIGTQAISVTTDPAVAVAFNDTPFLRNHFFEQEFYDLQDVEVLRGPQGTLFGRNATAGVVDIKSALPTNSYEAMLSADLGNYDGRRLEAMLNLPIVADTLSVRLAGEWTSRSGYTTDTTYNTPVDGRDLWSTRLTVAWKPAPNVQTDFIWEHFGENDDRLRSGKQLCDTDNGPGTVDGNAAPVGPGTFGTKGDYFVQGCLPSVSLYSPQAFGAPLGYALPYVLGLSALGEGTGINPYDGVTQSPNLRQIESEIEPHYIAKNDTFEVNLNWNLSPNLTFTSQTGYNRDYLWSTEDFNRFGSNPGFFVPGIKDGLVSADGTFCDPQLGCSNKLITQDLSTERSWQFSQEFRLASNFSGPFNFTVGANYLHYETQEDYYVFSNALTLINGEVSNYPCGNFVGCAPTGLPFGFRYNPPIRSGYNPDNGYVDPNPLSSVNGEGHNYFLSQNPYLLNSFAIFGDATYQITNDLKLDVGGRLTDDMKHFVDIPSQTDIEGYGYPVKGIVNQRWIQPTGRIVLDWTPKLSFTDQTLVYLSYSHGYKAGGANPPGATFGSAYDNAPVSPVHPLTFRPEYIEAFELGTKNTLLNGKLTLNADVFYYNYTGYQVSEIVDRTAINTNYNAHVEGAEIEANWRPLAGLKFGFIGGYENSGLAGGEKAVDLLDRTAGTPGWYVVKPFETEASSCIFPGYVAKNFLNFGSGGSPGIGPQDPSYCSIAYLFGNDPLTGLPYVPNPTVTKFDPALLPPGYPGFNPATAPNNGEGFSKDLHGNQLPNAPHFTASVTAEYTMPISQDWALTLHADYYAQSASWARVFEDPIDRIKGYHTVNLALTLTSANGWQVMGYVKNLFNVTAITGTFLNSDDTGLTTNVFLTDPRLYGIRVTKHFDQMSGLWGSAYSGYEIFSHLFSPPADGKPSPLWIELGGGFSELTQGQDAFNLPFYSMFSKPLSSPLPFEHAPRGSFEDEAKVTYHPDGSDWFLSAGVRYGRTSRNNHTHQSQYMKTVQISFDGFHFTGTPLHARYLDAFNSSVETHAIMDFDVGKDVGLGMLGLQGGSSLSGGIRVVRFDQHSGFSIHADPDYTFHALGPKYYHQYSMEGDAARSFHGIGPSAAWDGWTPIFKPTEASTVSFDWGLNGAVLIGRQTAHVHHQTSGSYVCNEYFNGGCKKPPNAVGTFSLPAVHSQYQRTVNANRRRTVAVPNAGGYAAISWRYPNAKVSLGLRADEFFGAMDGGIDRHKSMNEGFWGPFVNVSIGLGH